jgi:hypothetical protein
MKITPVTYRDLLDDPSSDELFAEYAKECSLPEIGVYSPQRDLYAKMEASGGLECFGVYDSGALVGFISLLVYVLPHYGKPIATTESIFLARSHRLGRAGRDMLDFIEARARDKECVAVLYTAPNASRFSLLLSMREEYRHSNNVFVRSL